MGPALALIACSLLAGGALVAGSARARAWLLVGALVLAPVILAVHVRDAEQLESLRDQPAVLGAAGVLGLGAVILLALLFTRVPAALPVAVALTLPFRIPIAVGGSTSNLLLPLYLVVAAGVLAYAAPRITGRVHEAPGWLERVLALVLVLYAAQTAYSSDTDRALENVVFFYVPFAALYVLMARTAWTARVAGLTLGVLAGLAAALAAIGYVEYATRHLLLNPKVIASNQLEDYFRVNSLFFDPNIYGRFLAIVLVLLVAWMLWRR
ncbi:MAG: hypothetical protein MUC84_09310, partial [Solirubrobacteraceae bacterium]|nr:hypothetical protein [Solirubrobacteraceae bacterium]